MSYIAPTLMLGISYQDYGDISFPYVDTCLLKLLANLSPTSLTTHGHSYTLTDLITLLNFSPITPLQVLSALEAN